MRDLETVITKINNLYDRMIAELKSPNYDSKEFLNMTCVLKLLIEEEMDILDEMERDSNA